MSAGRRILVFATLVAAAFAGYVAWTHWRVPPVGAPASPGVTTPLPTDAGRPHEPSPTIHGAAPDLARKAMAFEDLKLRAKRGDPAAQRMLAGIYDACFIVNIRPDAFLSGYERQAESLLEPGQASRMIQVARERAAECRSVDGGAVIPIELVKGWYDQAAKNGDLGAQAMSYAFHQEVLDQAGANHYVQRVVGSNDPAAVFLMGQIAGGPALQAAGEQYSDVVTGPAAGYAWMVVGCRMGYDCGPSSHLMGTLCLQMSCGEGGFEEYVRSGLRTDEEREDLDRKIDEVSRLVHSR